MKKILTNLVFIFTLFLSLSSCVNNESIKDSIQVIAVKAPKMISYTGANYWNTRAANVNGNLWYQDWERPTNITEEERSKVIEEFSKVRKEDNDIYLYYENFYVQQVYTGEQTYIDGYGSNIGTGSSHMNHLLVYNENYEVYWPEHTFGGYEHINNFNSGSNNTVYVDDETGEQYIGTTLMTNIKSYADKQFGYHNSTDSKNHFEYIILEIDGSYYIGFDFFANGTEEYPANKNMDVERDYIYNDWIIKITPAYLKGQLPEEQNPEEPQPEVPEVKPDVNGGMNEVEINLSVNDYNESGDWISSHLSIHIRANTDVEVFIPVPVEYYCDRDDMNISLKHDIEMVYGDSYKTSYNIEGNIVTLTVVYLEDGIKITTDGINEKVLEYCLDKYNDGITFEVWNYFNDNITREALKYYLDKSTVRFLDENPDLYVNAFVDNNDCTVDIDSTSKNSYSEPSIGQHNNNSDCNILYYLE